MPTVVVNFDVTVDASGTVEVFGQAPATMENVVVCDVELPVTDLYNGDSDAVFEFWEPSDALGDIKGTRKSGWTKGESLRTDLQSIIDGDMDASGAVPFDIYKTGSQSAYYNHESFGRLALSMYAHYLFGHVAATAAITNDDDFITKMNGNDDTAGSGHALLAKKFKDAMATDDPKVRVTEPYVGTYVQVLKDKQTNRSSLITITAEQIEKR
jgi:hypothetical protein